MELTRIIHPVGQGGFYTEELESESGRFTIIYDCGGTDQRTIEDCIDHFIESRLNGKNEIDAVFISHLHYDHINGLDYLLKNFNVKYLFLPQLTDDMLLEVMVYNNAYYVGTVEDINSFLSGVYGSGDNVRNNLDTRVVRVGISEQLRDFQRESIVSRDYLNERNYIPSGSRVSFGLPWLYIPYNPVINHTENYNLRNLLCEQFGVDDFSWQEIPSLLQDKSTINLVKSIYRKVFGSQHNAYSMTLFSGVASPNCYSFSMMPYRPQCDGCLFNNDIDYTPNCLYTGDFDIQRNFSALKKNYRSFWKTISMIQVPHHGSRNNFVADLYQYALKAFISVGSHNRYGHPNIDTLVGICRQQCMPIIVSEDLSTTRIEYYKLK